MAHHDPSYKLLFSHREMVADLIRGFVREDWARNLDLSTLERVREIGISEDLREREDDIVWRLRLTGDGEDRWLYVYLLLEFQSTVDAMMAVRLMTYVGLLYQDLHKAGEIGAGDPLPPVLAIVLYNGEPAWTAKTSLAERFDPRLPGPLLHWQPQFRYLLLEERRFGEAELAGLRNAVAVLFRLENSRTPQDIERILANLIDWLAAPEQASLRRAFVVWLKRVLLPARVPGVEIPNVIELQEMRDMLAERVKTWTEEWKEQGLKEGQKEGRKQGEAKLLRKLLVRRFGTLPGWVDERLALAAEPDLDTWADRAFDAQSLDEVFDIGG